MKLIDIQDGGEYAVKYMSRVVRATVLGRAGRLVRVKYQPGDATFGPPEIPAQSVLGPWAEVAAKRQEEVRQERQRRYAAEREEEARYNRLVGVWTLLKTLGLPCQIRAGEIAISLETAEALAKRLRGGAP
jgi:hypothetical protein